jgi:hypothetical protein
MRTILTAFMVCIMLSSCNEGKPKDILDAHQMEAVLTDIYLAEANSTLVNDSAHTIRNRNIDSLAVYYNAILTHHKISKEKLTKSVDWYKRNPEELDTIYARVITDLNRLQSQYPQK